MPSPATDTQESAKQDKQDVVSEESNANGPPTGSATLSSEDSALLDSYFGTAVREEIVQLYERVLKKPDAKAGSFGSVSSDPITDRQRRTQLHKVRLYDAELFIVVMY